MGEEKKQLNGSIAEWSLGQLKLRKIETSTYESSLSVRGSFP